MKAKNSRRREVTNAEMLEALSNPDINRIIKSVSLKYSRIFDPDELDSLAKTALWRTLGYHKPGAGCKLTSYLVSFLNYEYINNLKKPLEFISKHSQLDGDLAESGQFDELYNIMEDVKSLPEKYRIVVEQFYVECMSEQQIARSNKISLRATRGRLKKAIKMLKGVYDG